MPRWMVEASIVGSGGFVGAVLRYGLSGVVHRIISFTSFPWGTAVVNVLGCFVIGALAGLGEARQALGPQTRLFLLIGILGGFTTFSTFGYETFELLRDAQRAAAAANVVLQVALGIMAVWVGFSLLRAW